MSKLLSRCVPFVVTVLACLLIGISLPVRAVLSSLLLLFGCLTFLLISSQRAMREKGIWLSLSIAEAILSSLTIVSLIYSIKTKYFMPSETYRYDFVNAFTPLLFVLSYLTILVAMTSECVCFFY